MEQQFFTIQIERRETRMERLERRKRETRKSIFLEPGEKYFRRRACRPRGGSPVRRAGGHRAGDCRDERGGAGSPAGGADRTGGRGMSDKEARLFEVKHPERPAVQVQAVDRLRAVAAAAREWGDRWTEIARDCEVTDLGPAPKQKRKSRRTT